MGFVLHSHINKEGLRQVFYQVWYRSKRIVIALGVYCKGEDFIGGKIVRGKNKELYNKKIANAVSIIEDEVMKGKTSVPMASHEKVKDNVLRRLLGQSTDVPKLSEYWGLKIKELRSLKKFDSAIHNEQSMKRVLGLMKDTFISMVDYGWLDELKVRISRTGVSDSTLAGTFRDLRALLNKAVNSDIIDKSPFPRFKIPKVGQKVNVALSMDEFQRFVDFVPPSDRQRRAKDIFLFCYYCLGMRVRDALLLKWKNIKGTSIHYTTSKTGKTFKFQLPGEALLILSRYRGHGDTVFNVLADKKGAELVDEIKGQTRYINKALAIMFKNIGIDKPVSMHVARHTFAYHNRNSLSSFELRDALGHSSVTTTEGYAGSLSDKMDEIMKKVVR